MKIRLLIVGVFVAAAVLVRLLLPTNETLIAQGNGPNTTLISVSSSGQQSDDLSDNPSISADGRYIAFESRATNLVNNDTNNATDIFVHDRFSRQTIRISVSSNGTQGNRNSTSPSISPDGRYIAFASSATNLVPNDTNNTSDIFVHDRISRQTIRVSIDSNGVEGNKSSALRPAVSNNGQLIAFQSEATNLVSNDTNRRTDIFVHNRLTGQTERVSVNTAGRQGNSTSIEPSISGDGRYVAFASFSTNLAQTEDRNRAYDVFVHDRQTRNTRRLSIASDGSEANGSSRIPAVSFHGRHVAFQSKATNLVANDTNNVQDVFVHDLQTSQTTRASVSSNGVQANYQTAKQPPISAIGRYVAYQTIATNLVPGDTNGQVDIFVRNRTTGQTTRASISTDGVQGNSTTYSPAISANGRFVAFSSASVTLVDGDTNGEFDIYLHDRGVAEPTATNTPTTIATPTPTPTPTFTPTPTNTPTPTATPLPVIKIIPVEGGTIASDRTVPESNVVVTFPPNAFAADTLVKYSYEIPRPNALKLADIDRSFSLAALGSSVVITTTNHPITIVVNYDQNDLAGIITETMFLYRLDGTTWVTKGITLTDRSQTGFTNTTRYLGKFTVLGETFRHYIPMILRE